jgi:myo-inositol-1(or 4)-monophosphatase
VAAFLETAADIAREAGSLLLHYYERRPAFELKGEHDLVTAADRASEALIVERLKSHFPGHSILGEESGRHGASGGHHWYVDPLDGTTNFAHGYPMWNVTLALEHNGELLCGVVYDPLRGELFSAERGAGAYLNNRRLHVSKTATLGDSLLCTGFPSRRRHENVNVHFFHQAAMVSHGVRRAGAAALDLAYVAAGRLDGFWEFGLNPWDMAAGTLLILEAGGAASGMRGEPFSVTGPHLAVSNGLIHAELLALFADVFGGHYRVPLPQINP